MSLPPVVCGISPFDRGRAAPNCYWDITEMKTIRYRLTQQ
jgi:hypothetical protein